MTTEQVLAELKEVRYYYRNKEHIDELGEITSANKVRVLVNKYDRFFRYCPVRFYDIYGYLFVQNYTEQAVADTLHYTAEYIRKIKKSMIKYIADNITE